MTTGLSYLTGFGNEFESEARSGALPVGQFSPQQVPFGLYAEQFSSTAFTAPRADNRRTWFYRIRPSVVQGQYQTIPLPLWQSAPLQGTTPPDMMRWQPPLIPEGEKITFMQGIHTVAANGSVLTQQGVAIHVYACSASMHRQALVNADAETLLVPQLGRLLLLTECGRIELAPGEIAVVPRGMKWSVHLLDDVARGYLCENYGALLTLPERGPVGANGFANDRDFQYPVAWFEDVECTYGVFTKFAGRFYQCELSHSPFDVVAWTGNSAPYKYNLSRFNVINTVSYDHPDPSIFTVLTSPSGQPGVANLDFVIFPPRWMVAENTFRPPWYHRNVMSEFMGLIEGVYDAKEHGFVPGGYSLHNAMSPHGPEADAFERASKAPLEPQKYENTLAFMFETRWLLSVSEQAMDSIQRDLHYSTCWSTLNKHFIDPNTGE